MGRYDMEHALGGASMSWGRGMSRVGKVPKEEWTGALKCEGSI